MIFGYKEDGTIIENEATVVKYIFEKFNEYTTNPPADMVEEKIEAAKENGEIITYEEAVKRIFTYEIESRIWDEIKANPEFAETIKEYNYRNGYYARNGRILIATVKRDFGKIAYSASEPLISKEEWDKVQASLQKK